MDGPTASDLRELIAMISSSETENWAAMPASVSSLWTLYRMVPQSSLVLVTRVESAACEEGVGTGGTAIGI